MYSISHNHLKVGEKVILIPIPFVQVPSTYAVNNNILRRVYVYGICE